MLRPILACLLMIIVPMTGIVGTVSASTAPAHVISDQTWTAAGNPYLIDEMLVVMPDQTPPPLQNDVILGWSLSREQ